MRLTATVLILFSLLCITGTPSAEIQRPSFKSYIKQEMVDTTVMKGFYLLTEAAGMAGVGFRQQEAINTAKRLAKELRDKARNDPNARYVLWKVSELEAQIYLEERDLELQRKMQNQITINEYIDRYNTEVGKFRPDFSTMKKIHSQLLAIDPQKGNELADSYNKRYKSISREVVFSIEKAVLAGDDKKAREELGYCLRNKNYLSISNDQYYQIESRVDGLCNAYMEKPLIEKETDSADRVIKKNDFNTARTLLFSAEYRLKNSNEYYPQNVGQSLSSQIKRVTRRLAAKEDSLVSVNISILSRQGIQPADEYLQKYLKSYGVAREKTAYVDSMILRIKSPEKNQMAAEFERLSETDDSEEQTESVFDNIRESAQKKAQAKADSIRLANEIELERLQAERIRNDSILEARHEAQLAEQKKNQEKAMSVAMEIYSLIDKNKTADAENLYRSQYQPLSRYLPSDMLDVLSMTVSAIKETALTQNVSYTVSASKAQTSSSVPSTSASVTAIPVSSITKPLEQQTPPPPPAKISEALSPQDALKKNQDRAQQETVNIYSMIEKNQIADAYKKFQSIRSPLKKYLPKEAFDILESTVIQSMQYSSESMQ